MPDRAARDGFAGRALRFEWAAPRIALATFTRPEQLNTLSLELLEELQLSLETARTWRAAALILTGEGRAFCAGADLNLFLDERAPIGAAPEQWRDRYIAPLAELFDSFEEMPFPVIAAINGYALGGGAEMALSADFRLMARTAKFALPETRLGATPGAGGVQKLIRHVGRAKALEWTILGEHVDAEELDRRGLLCGVTDAEALLDASLGLARRIVALSPSAVAQVKRSVYVAEDADLRTARRFGVEALAGLMGTAEWREGVNAFLEKRAPRFVDDADE